MANRILLVATGSPSTEVLAKELGARGGQVEVTDSLEQIRNRLEAGDVDEIVIDACTLPAAELVERRVRALRPDCGVVLIRSSEPEAPDSSHDPATFQIRADRLADVVTAAAPSAGTAFAIESDRLIRVMEVLVGLLEVDDRYFGGFTSQVTRLSAEVGREMGMDKLALDEVVTAALLRDIGKSGVRRDVLEDEDTFTPDQKAHVENHVHWGVRLLEHIDFNGRVLPIIRHHHERYDGNGYPDGLKGREIPLGARIIATAEGFAAMVSDRPHRPAKAYEQAIEELMAGAGSQFDPEVVEVLTRVLDTDAVAGLVGQRSRIYIVDRDAEYSRLLRMRLLNEGFEVRTLSALNEDLDLSEDGGPILVLADIGEDPDRFFDELARFQSGDGAVLPPVALMSRGENRNVRLQAFRFGIEDFILKSGDLEEVTARVRNVLTRERRRRRDRSRRREGVVGRLENLPVTDIVQMLCMGGKTAEVEFELASGTARMFVKDGDLVHAVCGERTGEEAFFEILVQTGGEFRIVHGVLPDTESIEANSTFLLMEGIRRADEARRENEEVPPPFPDEDDDEGEPRLRVIRPSG